MLIKWILSGYLIVPIGSPLLGSFQSSGQHLDGYIAAASQFLPVCLHILLPENQRYILIFWKNARTQKTDSNHIYEILSQLSPCKQMLTTKAIWLPNTKYVSGGLSEYSQNFVIES
jgi:hypothetical protein